VQFVQEHEGVVLFVELISVLLRDELLFVVEFKDVLIEGLDVL
jgi:hypothetical protein